MYETRYEPDFFRKDSSAHACNSSYRYVLLLLYLFFPSFYSSIICLLVFQLKAVRRAPYYRGPT